MKTWMRILWPSFLVACLMEMAIFSMIDPTDIFILKKQTELSHNAVYTLSFFIFWLFNALSSGLTQFLCHDDPKAMP